MQTTISALANVIQSCIEFRFLNGGRLIHARILRLGVDWDTFLLNRLIELYKKCGRTISASHLFDKIPRRNVHSWMAILSAYCEGKQLDKAYEVFVSMPDRDCMSWNMMISALSRNGQERKALEVYREMHSGSFVPTRFTLSSVLRACGGLRDVRCGMEFHGVALKYGLDKNVFVGNALLRMYARCLSVGAAYKVFLELEERSEVTFTEMMRGLIENDRLQEAFYMFKLLHSNGINIDSISLSCSLGACARDRDEDFNSAHGKQIHGLTIKLGFGRDIHLSNSLLDMYAKSGDMESAERVFSNLSDVDVVSWNVMIGGYSQKYENKRALEYFEKMQSRGFEPSEVTYVSVLAACVRCGDVKTGRLIFDRMACPSLTCLNAMITGYFQNGYSMEAISLFRDMQLRNVQFDRASLAVLLSSCAELTLVEAGKQVHAASIKSDSYNDVYVASGLIGMYLNCGKVKEAKRIFEAMPQLDVVCWNSMIAGLSLNKFNNEAINFFKQMLEKGVSPTEFSHATVLSCCARLSSLSQGKQVHCRIVKDGYADDVFVGSALIDMYCKCGDIGGARQFFDRMVCKGTVTWNEMIHGYAQNGLGDEAICLYKQMISSGAKPDAITFVAVLTACSHSGLDDSGTEIFKSMQQVHGVEPLVDHYACIIDSLACAGRFSELEGILEKLPCKDDPNIWEIVLSSCRIHGNVGLAKIAAGELFRSDPNISAPYVLLANMYSSLGRWDDVQSIRESMKERQISKSPGYSWVDHIEPLRRKSSFEF